MTIALDNFPTFALSGFSTVVTNTPSTVGGGGGAGKAVFAPVTVTRDLGDGSPQMNLNAAQGRHLASAQIVQGPTSDGSKLTIDLNDVLLTEVDEGAGSGGAPQETIAMDYAKIKYTYVPQGGAAIVFEFDILQNTGGGGGGIPGQYLFHGTSSVPPGLSGASDVSSFSTGISATGFSGTAGGGGAGKATFKDFFMQKGFDFASVAEIRSCASGTHSASAALSLVRDTAGAPNVWFLYNLTDVLVTSVAVAGDSSGNVHESVSFGFRKIEWNFTPSGGATQRAAWDIAQNKAASAAPF
jgi:type VI secretion system secreted protein Hcp